jgi:hypothetical protein
MGSVPEIRVAVGQIATVPVDSTADTVNTTANTAVTSVSCCLLLVVPPTCFCWCCCHVQHSRRLNAAKCWANSSVSREQYFNVLETFSGSTVRECCDGCTNQPKKRTKGAVKCRRETSSLAKFDHFCIRIALLGMVNGGGGGAYGNGVLSWRKALICRNMSYCFWWEIVRSGNLSFMQRILVGWLSGS